MLSNTKCHSKFFFIDRRITQHWANIELMTTTYQESCGVSWHSSCYDEWIDCRCCHSYCSFPLFSTPLTPYPQPHYLWRSLQLFWDVWPGRTYHQYKMVIWRNKLEAVNPFSAVHTCWYCTPQIRANHCRAIITFLKGLLCFLQV